MKKKKERKKKKIGCEAYFANEKKKEYSVIWYEKQNRQIGDPFLGKVYINIFQSSNILNILGTKKLAFLKASPHINIVCQQGI